MADECSLASEPAARAADVGAIERVFRAEYGRAVAILVRAFGDIDLAEEAVQDAFTTALERWPASGLPPSPAGWIITTARNRAIDRLRREASSADRHAQAALLHAREEPGEEEAVPDDRLPLDASHLFHAIRADLLRRLGRTAEVALAYEAALARAENTAERAFLEGCLQTLR